MKKYGIDGQCTYTTIGLRTQEDFGKTDRKTFGV